MFRADVVAVRWHILAPLLASLTLGSIRHFQVPWFALELVPAVPVGLGPVLAISWLFPIGLPAHAVPDILTIALPPSFGFHLHELVVCSLFHHPSYAPAPILPFQFRAVQVLTSVLHLHVQY